VTLLRELADPLRLRIVDRLAHAGPATVSRLAADLHVGLPQLSNHLRRLRAAGLVRVRRAGRQATYELADAGLELLLPLLDRITGRVAHGKNDVSSRTRSSRTCYGHLAGPIGVALYEALRERDALRDRPDGMVELGADADAVLGSLGVDVAAVEPGRRRFAYECLDATERAPHLAGALGDALAGALLERRWVEREPPGRAVRVTAAGRRELRRTLGVAVPA
jgi:DNA-binding transcriptional ArsR family regulator